MQNKLQELTEKLYSEGLSKGKKEAEDLIRRAKSEAEEIISKANEEAGIILAKAGKEAEDLKIKVINEIKLGAKQSVNALKTEIETLILSKTVGEPLKNSMSETEFIKKLLISAVSAFRPENAERNTLSVILPESLKKELDGFVESEIKKNLKANITVTFDNKLVNGFRIGPKEDGYVISFTDADFRELFGEYLRPKTREILFSE
jgi:V/A-type H+-transporting ATPase subunit E